MPIDNLYGTAKRGPHRLHADFSSRKNFYVRIWVLPMWLTFSAVLVSNTLVYGTLETESETFQAQTGKTASRSRTRRFGPGLNSVQPPEDQWRLVRFVDR